MILYTNSTMEGIHSSFKTQQTKTNATNTVHQPKVISKSLTNTKWEATRLPPPKKFSGTTKAQSPYSLFPVKNTLAPFLAPLLPQHDASNWIRQNQRTSICSAAPPRTSTSPFSSIKKNPPDVSDGFFHCCENSHYLSFSKAASAANELNSNGPHTPNIPNTLIFPFFLLYQWATTGTFINVYEKSRVR